MSRKVMMNGNYVAWNDATVHITTHALHYGTAVFEGIRAYYNDDRGQSFIVRLMEHVERLYRNIRVLRLTVPLTKQEFADAVVDVVRENALKEDVYIRPIIYWGAGSVGLTRTVGQTITRSMSNRWAITSPTATEVPPTTALALKCA
jgi:branched-chain amino acid aminotransferase